MWLGGKCSRPVVGQSSVFSNNSRRADAAGRGSWGPGGLRRISHKVPRTGSRTLITSRVHHVALLLTRIGLVPLGGGDGVGICMARSDVRAGHQPRASRPYRKRWGKLHCHQRHGTRRLAMAAWRAHTDMNEAHCIAVRQPDRLGAFVLPCIEIGRFPSFQGCCQGTWASARRDDPGTCPDGTQQGS